MINTVQGSGGVAVGVDGSDTGYAAVSFAAGEAERLGVHLDLIHVLPASIPVDPEFLSHVADPSLQSYGCEILERARKTALETRPAVEIESHLLSGSRTQQLLEISKGAKLVVLGNRSPKALGRIWTGGTVTGVSGGSACPVVAVPVAWEPAEVHGRIAVAVKTPGEAGGLFESALRLAHDLGSELVVLHAWRLEGVYDDIVADRTVAERWQRNQTALIERDLAGPRERFPDVPVRVYVRHEDPAHAIVRVTGGVDRLLLQRPPSGRLVNHLGRVARAVLRETHCPAVVLPDHPAARALVRDERVEALVP
jgi:nucleotide-binding universal stress UspA family protein